MDKPSTAILILVLLSLLGVLGDYFLKTASSQERIICNRWFPVGLAIYSSTAFGWVFALRSMKLATIGAVYSMCMILFLAIVGVVVFKEHMSMTEIAGMLMAVASLILLTRFT